MRTCRISRQVSIGVSSSTVDRWEKKSGCMTIERRSVSSVPPRPVT